MLTYNLFSHPWFKRMKETQCYSSHQQWANLESVIGYICLIYKELICWWPEFLHSSKTRIVSRQQEITTWGSNLQHFAQKARSLFCCSVKLKIFERPGTPQKTKKLCKRLAHSTELHLLRNSQRIFVLFLLNMNRRCIESITVNKNKHICLRQL
jgi:hypothetical protein